MVRFALPILLLVLSAAPASAAPYTTVAGPERATPRFVVAYKGGGTYRTKFHATPPNQGGKPDTNDAHDSSRQSWDVKFRRGIGFPTCGQPAPEAADPCAGITGLSGASGPTTATGRVNHKHVDGLYRQLDRTVKCRLRKSPSPRRRLEASIDVRYIPESQSFGVSASSPVSTALSLFPAQCPQQGDSIDRILDFYAVPGFSFAPEYGSERWFSSSEVVIPADVFHRSAKIKIPLADTPAVRPPRRCAVRDPSFERCKTAGVWSGVLTFAVRPPAASGAANHTKPKVRAPRSGQYDGRAGRGRDLVLYVSGKSIELAAFDFPCSGAEGRTSLNGIPLKKTRKGYKFGIRAHGSITFSDGRPDENGAVEIAGRFSRAGGRASGTLRVRSPHCHTGDRKWTASR